LVAWATAEIETKSKRQRDRNAADAAKGRPYWRRRPFGLQLDGTQHTAEGEAIRWACAQVLAGATLASIVREFNARGLRTPAQGTVGGNLWATVNIRQLLTNPRIAGLRVYQGTTVKGNWTPAVPEETWRAVVGVLKDPARGTGSKHGRTASALLTGIATCERCGAFVHSALSRGSLNYRCYNADLYRSAAPAETKVLKGIFNIVSRSSAYDLLTADDRPEAQDLRIKAGLLRASIAEWEAAASEVGPAEYLRITKGIRAELAEVESALGQTDRAALFAGLGDHVVKGAWAEFLRRWESIPLERQRALVRALFVSVVLVPGSASPVLLTHTQEAARALAAPSTLTIAQHKAH